MLKRRWRLLLLTILIICISFSSIQCGKSPTIEQSQETFDSFLNHLFIEEVKGDSLSLNYSLSEPENYGIELETISLGEYGIDYMKKDLLETENTLERLHTYPYKNLTSQQQLTHDILDSYLKTQLALGHFPYYAEALGPTTGIQAQLPILLAEFSFYDQEDIDHYIKLLPCVYDYFEDIIQYEKEKATQGLFMSKDVANRIISQCDSFIAYPEENFLISYFNEKIDSYEGLTEEERRDYKKKNRDAVLAYVVPAYELLIDTLYQLKSYSKNDAGLHHFPQGKEYYQALAQYRTASNKTIKEMADMLDQSIQDDIIDITTLTLTDPDVMSEYISFSSFPMTDPEDILAQLQEDIKEDFPDAVPVNCEIKYVDESLSEYLSPAMYLIPPIDNYTENSIYINGRDEETLSMIYPTVAHEGYPGHLYQNVYFRSQDPAPIRNLMNFTGYDEGWATYVEYYSYDFSLIDSNLADFLVANNRIILNIYARTDIGIHYDGWTKEEVIAYIHSFIDSDGIAEAIYDTLLEEPGIYLPYAIGYLEMQDLKDRAQETLGSNFVPKEFHEFILDMGPAPFKVISTYMDDWMKNQ